MAATPQLTIYDYDQVSVLLGPILIDDFQEGEGVTIETPESFTMKKGGRGHVTRSKTLDNTSIVTITIMQSSASMDLLGALHTLDRNAPNGAGVVPLWIRDRGGRSLYTAPQAWIAKAPDVTFGTEATPRAWIIHVAKLSRTDGGN